MGSIRRAWEKVNPNPYIACHYGITENPLYHRCEICLNNTTCDYGITEMRARQNDYEIRVAMDSGLIEPDDFIVGEFGHYVVNEEKRKRNEKLERERVTENFVHEYKTKKTVKEKILAWWEFIKTAFTI